MQEEYDLSRPYSIITNSREEDYDLEMRRTDALGTGNTRAYFLKRLHMRKQKHQKEQHYLKEQSLMQSQRSQ
jgi:hypothetical protein